MSRKCHKETPHMVSWVKNEEFEWQHLHKWIKLLQEAIRSLSEKPIANSEPLPYELLGKGAPWDPQNNKGFCH